MRATHFVRGLAVATVLSLAVPAVSWANGEEFFHDDDAMNLYYFGHIKDKAGKTLDGVTITITAKKLGMRFPVRNWRRRFWRGWWWGRRSRGWGKRLTRRTSRSR